MTQPLALLFPLKKNKKQKTGPQDLKKKQKITEKYKNAVLQFRYPEKNHKRFAVQWTFAVFCVIIKPGIHAGLFTSPRSDARRRGV